MGFDGAAFVDRFNTVWNGHDVDGILAMMTDDVVFEASFGKEPWGTRVVGKPAVRELLQGNDWVLVKGSRSMRMERVVEALAAAVGSC